MREGDSRSEVVERDDDFTRVCSAGVGADSSAGVRSFGASRYAVVAASAGKIAALAPDLHGEIGEDESIFES